MKKYAVISLVVIMLVLSVVPAFAKGPAQNSGSGTGVCTGTGMQYGIGSNPQYGAAAGMRNGFGVSTPYALSGTIAAVNGANRTVTVTVVCGNRQAYPYIGQDVTLVTTDATRFLLRNEDGTVTPITFDYLEAGQNVSSHGTLVEGVFTATRITSGALLNCQP
jgi:hypothetical protein